MGVKLGNGKWAIKEDKLLAYNDNSGRFFNKEFDFSRGSSATYVAKDGLIKTAGLQATNLVNNGDFSELGSELITNGDFSDGLNGWTTHLGNPTVSNGVVHFTGDLIKQTILTVGKTYKVTVNVTEVNSGLGKIQLGGTIVLFSGIAEQQTFYVTATSNTVFFIGRNLDTDDFKIDNVSVKQVDPNDYWTITNNTGTDTIIKDGYAEIKTDGTFTQISQSNILSIGKTYKLKYNVIQSDNGNLGLEIGGSTTLINSTVGTHTFIWTSNSSDLVFKRYSGVLDISITNISVKEIQTDVPRIDFTDDATGHLLLEPQSTNLYAYSEDFSQSVWNKLNCNVTLTSEVAPNGNANSVYNLTGTSANLYTSGSANIEHTISFYIKSNNQGKDSFKLRLGNNTSVEYTATNEWVRYEFTSTPTTSVFGITTTSAPNNEFDLLIWGAQSEALSYATSYIPTFGSTVTRNADVCNNSGSAQDFNSEEGVLYAEIAALADDGTFRLISLDGGDNTNVVKFGYRTTSNAIYYEVRSGNVSQAFQVYTTTDVKQFHKVAVLYQQNNFKLFINGVNVLSDTSGITPVGLNNISFDVNNAAPFYGRVRELQVFTEALTDEQLQKLTTI